MSDTQAAAGFVWYDLMTPDPGAAVAFYSKVAGWGTTTWDGPEPYTMWTVGEAPIGGVMTLPADAGAPPHWLAYTHSADVDATVAKATSLGGAVLVPPTDIPGAGRFAVLKDPQGAAFAVYRHGAASSDSQAAPEARGFSWHELGATDLDAALRFYGQLFGWEKLAEHDMGEMGPYVIFGRGEKQLGGMFKKPPHIPGPDAFWLYYIHVDDVARVVQVVKDNGGQVLVEPMEVPGGDMIAQCLDPQGAAFAIHALKTSH